MVSVDQAVIAKINKYGTVFEILVDPDKSLEFKRGKAYSIENLLAVNHIYIDAKKGEKASMPDLTKAFGTADIFKVAEIIIREGEIQLTTEQKRHLIEQKRLEIANIIAKQGVDPKTHLPHPPQRILNAMAELHLDIDPFRNAKDHVTEIIEKLQKIIPISFEKVTLAVKIPAEYAGKASHALRDLGELSKEEWTSTSWVALITVPAGMQSNLFDKVNSLTSGKAEIKVIKRDII